MLSEKEINAKILEITLLIQDKYPELSKYLAEMEVTLPTSQTPDINCEHLMKYYESLEQLLKKYILEHPTKKPLI